MRSPIQLNCDLSFVQINHHARIVVDGFRAKEYVVFAVKLPERLRVDGICPHRPVCKQLENESIGIAFIDESSIVEDSSKGPFWSCLPHIAREAADNRSPDPRDDDGGCDADELPCDCFR